MNIPQSRTQEEAAASLAAMTGKQGSISAGAVKVFGSDLDMQLFRKYRSLEQVFQSIPHVQACYVMPVLILYGVGYQFRMDLLSVCVAMLCPVVFYCSLLFNCSFHFWLISKSDPWCPLPGPRRGVSHPAPCLRRPRCVIGQAEAAGMVTSVDSRTLKVS